MSEPTIRVEFHSHTRYSKDSLLHPADLVRAARAKRLGKVVITDHNSIQGALEAQKLAPDLVIVGEEIMTSKGEILAAFVKEEIPRGLEPLEVIRRLRDQGAFISVSHPFDRIRPGAWKCRDLDEIIGLVDAIEIFNARCWYPADNDLAQTYAKEHTVPGTVGSDAHTGFELGTAWLEVPAFETANDLRQVIQAGKIGGRMSPGWVHLTSRWASMVKAFQSKP
jgi:predicted metal-dependent phosphoesterase TrpH